MKKKHKMPKVVRKYYHNGVEYKIKFPVPPKPITTAGIYWSADLGLISLSSNGTDWLTIADKNLGATKVYNYGDELSEENCGKYYQWGNNYGFPWAGTVTTATTTVNASSYGPGNYYSNSTYRLYVSGSNEGWDNSGNRNLRGEITNTLEARRGPCPEGFHVPYSWNKLANILYSLGLCGTISGTEPAFRTDSPYPNLGIYLKAPNSGRRDDEDGLVRSQGSKFERWQSFRNTFPSSFRLEVSGSYFRAAAPSDGGNPSFGFSIRPVKNTPIQPDTSWTKLN